MKLGQSSRYYVQYHDPAFYRRMEQFSGSEDWYWLDFSGGLSEGWLTGREARDAFISSEDRDKKFRVVKVTVTEETVLDLE